MEGGGSAMTLPPPSCASPSRSSAHAPAPRHAHGTGALSAKSLATLDVVDVGAQIQAGLGCSIDDVGSSEVVLVTMMPDDSQSIAQAGNTSMKNAGKTMNHTAMR